MIHGAVPAGSMRAAGQMEYLAAVRANPQLAHVRADRWDSTWRVARALALRADWQLGTARPTWDVLMGDTGLARRTLARRLVDLREAGLLGIVATGRTAGTDPNEPDGGDNQAAVYVLTTPHAFRLLTARQNSTPAPGNQEHQAQDDQHEKEHQDDQHQDDQAADPSTPTTTPTRPNTPVDETGTPSLSLSVTAKEQPPHARETKIHPELASSPCPLRDLTRAQLPAAQPPHTPDRAHAERASSPSPLRDLSRAELIAAGPLCGGGEKALWTTKSRRLLAAAELRRRDPILGRASTPDVASMLREWLLTQEWSINDLHHAINHRPDGSLWPHQLTVADVIDVRSWIRHRMTAWRSNPLDPTSPPGTSPSARAEADQRQQRARAQARTDADAAARAAWMPVEDRSPAAEAALTAARARLRLANLTRAHRQ